MQRYREFWGSKVQVVFEPFFLGGIMQGSGNKVWFRLSRLQPPATNAFKGKYMLGDLERGADFFKSPFRIRFPDNFPSNSLVCQRLLTALKLNQDLARMEKTSALFWEAYWSQNKDFSEANIRAVLQQLFSPAEIQALWDAKDSAAVKDELKRVSSLALDVGSFGAPWFIIQRHDGVQSTFFGSDRFEAIAHWLSLPYCGPVPSPSKL
ncbi:Glutathione S-transferase kappa 1 [Kappamyces sp. JEL0680]|nr:Glutathione S-transferase kappa 1 [Kappamyces sp. JEL0680]